MKTERHLLFLFEIVLDLLIFAVCAVVCTGLLMRARSMSEDSAVLTDAVYLAQSAAETWRAGGTPNANADGYTVEITPLAGKNAASVTVRHWGETVFTLEEVARP